MRYTWRGVTYAERNALVHAMGDLHEAETVTVGSNEIHVTRPSGVVIVYDAGKEANGDVEIADWSKSKYQS